jgi:hypothetical protein
MQDYVKPFLKSQIFDHRDNTFSYETNMNTAEVREDALRKGREEGTGRKTRIQCVRAD